MSQFEIHRLDRLSHPAPASYMLGGKHGDRMPRRETYTTKVRCLDCANEGRATFNENENPVFTKGELDRITQAAGEGFELMPDAPFGLKCSKCGSSRVEQA